MRLLILALLALVIGVVLSVVFLSDPGFVVVGYHGQLIRTSFSLFILIALAAMAVLFVCGYLIYYVLSLPKRLQEASYSQKKSSARKALMRGSLALIEGNWKRAEETLNYGAPNSDSPVMYYLNAAHAAHERQAPDRREAYLKLAEAANSGAELAVNLTRAELQLNGHQLLQAKQTLTKLRAARPNNRQVLRLCCKLYQETGDWQEILALLPVMRQRNAFAANALTELETKAYSERLKSLNDGAALEKLWGQIPQTLRQHPDLIALYATRMQAFSLGGKAIPLIEKSLRSTWNPKLARLYGAIDSNDRANQISIAEQWLPTHGDDPELSLSLGRLCFRHGLWGKARYYLEGSIKKEPRPESYRLLADTLERIGDKDAAAVFCRKGLVLATGGADMAEPGTGSESEKGKAATGSR